jgi:Arc/MetJ family transcription regulator
MCMIIAVDTHWRTVMRTNIVIDDDLMTEALKATGGAN